MGGRRRWEWRRARLKRMAPPWAIARKYRGLHTGWETARGTVQKAAQCRFLANVNVCAAFRGTKEKFVVFLHWPPRSMPMSQDDEDRFRPRLGRIRSDPRGGAATKSFFTRVRKIARQHGAGPPGASAYRKSGGSGGRARGRVGVRRGRGAAFVRG